MLDAAKFSMLKLATMTTNEAIAYFRTRAALARAIAVTPGAVSQWGEHPPIGRQYEIEVRTGGDLKADRDEVQVRAEAT